MTKYFPQYIITGQFAGQRKGIRKMIFPSEKNKNVPKRHNKQKTEQDRIRVNACKE